MLSIIVNLMTDVLISELTPEEIASICDHTFLHRVEEYREPDVNAVEKRKEEFYNFLEDTILGRTPYAVCVYPEDVLAAKDYLKNTGIKVVSVVGFPDGCWYRPQHKTNEMGIAVTDGADEIDMVMNYDALKDGEYQSVRDDILAVKNQLDFYSGNKDIVLKVILETSELNYDQIKKACKIASDCGVDFVKTSTGFTSHGATPDDLKVMRDNFSGGVKISGGVHSGNLYGLLCAASGRSDGYIDLDPMKIRIGESSLF